MNFQRAKWTTKNPAFWNAVFVLFRLFFTGSRQLAAGNRFSMMACNF